MQFNMTNKQYNEYVKRKSPGSATLRNCFFAFITGGGICIIGEFLNMFFSSKGFTREVSSSLTAISLIFAGALLTALNVYDDIAKYGGGGTLVPITGFANAVVSSAMEFKTEGYVMGLGAKIFTIAGPVIVYGVISSIVCGVIYYIF